MNQHFVNMVLQSTGARALTTQSVIQTLWSGYGEIVKVGLAGSRLTSAVLKYIVLPTEANHPRGWNTARSHARKIKSYEVEMAWYRDWSDHCGEACRVANCYASTSNEHEHVIVLEDLDAVGFPLRKSQLNKTEVKVCLAWLANFHATFLGESPIGLWETGTYWHLDTRPDELAAMQDMTLKKAAVTLDHMLTQCQYQTVVHGDAKVANFCFSRDAKHVAVVDFQYVGGGCGMKDVAYFLGSCLNEQQCEQWQSELLDYYFEELKQALIVLEKDIDGEAVKAQWLPLFAVAWTDFYRFLLGWMPTHHKINAYSQRLALQVLDELSSVE